MFRKFCGLGFLFISIVLKSQSNSGFSESSFSAKSTEVSDFFNSSKIESTCKTPSINNGNNQETLCGLNFPNPGLTLNCGIQAGNGKTFQWFKESTLLVGQNAPTLNITSIENTATTGPGTYRVRVDSAGCIKEDQITVLATIPTPDLGNDKLLCNPAAVNLETNVVGNGLIYKWEADNTPPFNISGLVELKEEIQPILQNVRLAGLYRLTISASGCPNVFAAVNVTSNLPTPVDNCIPNPGASTSLSISDPGLQGSNYNWYATQEGGTALATNTLTFNTPILNSTTTYYVQNMSAQGVVVGKLSITSSPASVWDVDDFDTADKKLKFTVSQNLTLDSITVYLESSGNLTIRILKENNAELMHSKTFTSLPKGANRVSLSFLLNPDTYLIDAVGTTVPLLMEGAGATGVSFPYVSPGLISIVNNASWASGWYPIFYAWKISTSAVCARLPVQAKVGNCVINCNLPQTNKNVSGSSVCTNNNATVSILNSESGVSYQAFRGNTAISTSVNGTGSNITLTIPFAELISGNNLIGVRANNSCGTSNLNNAVVIYNVPTISNAGNDQFISTSSTTLSANEPSTGTGEWSIVSGTANIVSPNLNNTTINGIEINSTVVFRWTISINGCSSQSDVSVSRTINSLNDNDFEWFCLFPNPTSEKFDLRLEPNKVQQIQVFDSMGKTLFQSSGTMEQYSFGQNWKPGVYQLKIISGNQSISKTIIKN
ncbi:MAG: T9SS type A sorting domain-containing protein [Cytophagales bacterium]